MASPNFTDFGKLIIRLINKENLLRDEVFNAFCTILRNQVPEMLQGAFLAALAAKGETKDEIAGCWEAIYTEDTVKVYPQVNGVIVENSGTGMDTFKTFNISTAASVIAAAHGGIYMARHGARAITSKCGTVDIAEALGIDVECDISVVSQSLQKCGIALFNGMSSKVHPGALGRILSQISFGSILNTAASLASPVRADIGIRGVYSKSMVLPVLEVMKEIGYKRAIVVHGSIDYSEKGMDEASVCGETLYAQLHGDGSITEGAFRPEHVGLTTHVPKYLTPADNLQDEVKNFRDLLKNSGSPVRTDAAILNAALILYAAETVHTVTDGVLLAKTLLSSGKADKKLTEWIQTQNSKQEKV